MEKKLYQKPCFISKTDKTVSIVPAVLAAAAGAAAASVATSAVNTASRSMFSNDITRSLSSSALKPVASV